MKKIFRFSFFALLAGVMSTACINTHQFDGDDITTAYTEIVTIVDGDYETSYYVEFDNGKKAYVTENKQSSSITFPSKPEAMRGEVRKLIYYHPDDTEMEGYDMSIRILQMTDISTELLKDIHDDEYVSEIENHDAPVTVSAAAFGKNRNYLTLEMAIRISQDLHYDHSIILTHNPYEDGVYEDIYEGMKKDDSYLWLELYHDANGDYSENAAPIYSCTKIDTESLGLKDMNSYRGIKILYKDIIDNQLKVHSLEF